MNRLEQALESFEQSIEGWQPSLDESKKLYSADRKQMRAVLNLCKKDKWREAYNKAWMLDTILRDNIPDVLWDRIVEQGEN